MQSKPETQGTNPQLPDVIVASRPNLSNKKIQKVEKLITKYENIFATNSSNYGRTDRVYHHTEAGEPSQFQQPPRSSFY
jgi:hypothetical protein